MQIDKDETKDNLRPDGANRSKHADAQTLWLYSANLLVIQGERREDGGMYATAYCC